MYEENVKQLDVAIGSLIFNNGLPFRTCESKEMADIIIKAKTIPRDYKVPSREKIRGPILDACYNTMRDRQTKELLLEADVFGLSASGDGATVKKKPLMNAIVHGTHHPVAVREIFDCTGHIEGGDTKNSKFISDKMKGVMDGLDPTKELFDLVNFDGATVVQVAGEILEIDRPNLMSMLCCLHGGNTCFSDIGKLDFMKELVRESKLVHRVFGGKFHHCYAFFQKSVKDFKNGKKYNLTTMTDVRCASWAISFNRELFLM